MSQGYPADPPTAETQWGTPVLLVVALVALAVLVRMALEVTLGFDSRYLVYLAAVVGAGAGGGLWPGLTATLLGGAAGFFRLLPGHSPVWTMDPPEAARVTTYVVLGIIVSLVCESLRGARRRLELQALACEERLTALRRSEVLLSSVQDSVADAIIGITEQGVIESFTRSAERLFGYRAEEIIGRDFNVLVPEPHDPASERGPMNTITRDPLSKSGRPRETIARRLDGTTFPVDLARSEFVLDGARHFTGVVRDITEQRRLTEQLRQSQKMEAVGRLAGGVAHDFNNLLTVISGYAEMLVEGGSNDGDRDAVTAISIAAERASSLTKQLLAFSRQAVLEPKVLDLNDTIGQAEPTLRKLLGDNVRLQTVLDSHIGLVRVDPGLINQVLSSLATNARDAMPRGGWLRIRTSTVEFGPAIAGSDGTSRRGRHVMLAVADTGEGMTPEAKVHVFEPFFTIKSPVERAGLGLATVYGIVRQSGGDIEVSSEIGQGTTFRIYFPVVEASASISTAPAASDGAAPSADTILLVEDEEIVRTMAQLALRRYGYTVLSACDGQEALRVLREHSGTVDLMITDVVMPGMSVTELADTARSMRPAMKVLYVSGYTDDAAVRQGLLQADVEFLQKPYTPATLSRKLQQVLQQPHRPPFEKQLPCHPVLTG